MSTGPFVFVATRGRRFTAVIGTGLVLAWLAAAPAVTPRPIEELPTPTVLGWFPFMTTPLWPYRLRR